MKTVVDDFKRPQAQGVKSFDSHSHTVDDFKSHKLTLTI